MDTPDPKAQLHDLISQSRTSDALKHLGELILPESPAASQVVILQGRYRRNENDRGSNVISHEEYSRERDRVSTAMLTLFNSLTEADLNLTKSPMDVMEDGIVVLHTPEREAALRALFRPAYFPRLRFTTDPTSAVIVFSDIVIYDFPEGSDEDTFKYFLDELPLGGPYVLYYGATMLRWLNQAPYVDLVHRANTKFSLHARLRELSLFLRYSQEG